MSKKALLKFLKYLKSSDQFTILPLSVCITSSLLTLIAFLIYYKDLPPELPLFYSLTWGNTQLVQKSQFLLLPIITIFTCLVNIGISSQLHSSQVVLKRILLVSAGLISTMLLITAINILFIFL